MVGSVEAERVETRLAGQGHRIDAKLLTVQVLRGQDRVIGRRLQEAHRPLELLARADAPGPQAAAPGEGFQDQRESDAVGKPPGVRRMR